MWTPLPGVASAAAISSHRDFLESFTRNQPDGSSDSHRLGNETPLQALTEVGGKLGERLASRAVPTLGPSTPGSLVPHTPAAEEVLRDAGFAGKVDASHHILVKSSGRRQCPPLPTHFILMDPGNFPASLRGLSHATRLGGADSALAFWVGAGVPSLHCTF